MLISLSLTSAQHVDLKPSNKLSGGLWQYTVYVNMF